MSKKVIAGIISAFIMVSLAACTQPDDGDGNKTELVGGYSIVKYEKTTGDEVIEYAVTQTGHSYVAKNYNFYFEAEGEGSANFGSIQDKTMGWTLTDGQLTVKIFGDRVTFENDTYAYQQSLEEYTGKITENGFTLSYQSGESEITYTFEKDTKLKASDYIGADFFSGEYSSLECANANVRFSAKLNSDHSGELTFYNDNKEEMAKYEDCVYAVSVSVGATASKYKITIYYNQADALGFSFYYTESGGFEGCLKEVK